MPTKGTKLERATAHVLEACILLGFAIVLFPLIPILLVAWFLKKPMDRLTDKAVEKMVMRRMGARPSGSRHLPS